jgi:ankyrin repeat protein
MQQWQPTALLLAIESGLPAAARLLIERGADVNAQTGFPGHQQPDMNALMWATHAEQVEVVSALLDKGAGIDAQNSSGYSALMIAAAAGQVEALELLLRRGANPTLRNRSGHSALELSRTAGHEAAARLLAPLTPP